MNNITKIISSQTIRPHLPFKLATASPSTLILNDDSTYPRSVRWFDCNDMKLKDKSIQLLQKFTKVYTTDITCARDGGEEFLISSHWAGIFSFKTRTGQLKWSVEGRLPGMKEDLYAYRITSDDHGNLFVCDTANKCMQMFSVSDGRYLGCLFREGEHGFGKPWEVCWCEEMSSLLVADDQGWLSKVELEYDNWVNGNL